MNTASDGINLQISINHVNIGAAVGAGRDAPGVCCYAYRPIGGGKFVGAVIICGNTIPICIDGDVAVGCRYRIDAAALA